MVNPLIAKTVCPSTSLHIPPLSNTSTCLISLRYLLFVSGNQQEVRQMRAIAISNIKDRCSEQLQYSERSVFSPILKMFYKKSRIVEFYTDQQNLTKQLLRRPDLVCWSGSMVCHGIWMTLEKDHCMNCDDFQTLTSYPFFPITHLFCQNAIKQAQFEK
jgi:Cft2 family RNA processing exonuclease